MTGSKYNNRFYCDSLDGPKAEILGSEAHHLVDVLRMTKGQTVELFDGTGKLATAEIETLNNKRTTLKIVKTQTLEKPSRPQIIIASAISIIPLLMPCNSSPAPASIRSKKKSTIECTVVSD